MGGVDFFGTFPALHPGWLLLIYVVVPWIPILIGVSYVSKETHFNGSRTYTFFCNLVLFFYRYAPLMSLILLFWSTIMLINQASYTYRHSSLNLNPSYFLSVDLPSFDVLNAINYAIADNSYDETNALAGGARRRLQTDGPVDTTLTLTYHTSNFDDLATNALFQQICQAELAIVKDNTTCIDTNGYESILSQFYHPLSCTPITNPVSNNFYLLGLINNARYVQDAVDITTPSTSVIVSYFQIGNCSNQYNPTQFYNILQQYATEDIQITYTNPPLNRHDVNYAIRDGGRYLTLSAVVCTIVLIFGLRGFIMPLLTMFGFFFSLINASSFIPLLNYNYFSILNMGTFLILMAYGSSAAMMWASAWRRQVKPASHPTVANILNTYLTVGQSLLYITLLGAICCFVLLSSPVNIVSQFGAFTGFSLIFFYLIFHYVFIPWWIFSSWFILPKRYHRNFRHYRSLCCPCYDSFLNFFKDKKGWTTAAIIAEFVPDDDDDAAFNDEEDATVAGVVHAEEVQVIDPNTQTIDRSEVEGGMTEDEEGGMVGGSVVARSMLDGEEEDEDEEYDYNEEQAVSTSQADMHSQARSISHSQRSLRQATSANEVVAAASPVEHEEPEPEPIQEMEHDTNFCRGKRPLKFFGLVVVIVVLIGILIVYIISIQKFRLNLGLPNMVHDMSSNLGYQYQIVENYKFDLLTVHTSSVVTSSQSPTHNPTRAPLSLRPTPRPTRSPTQLPTTGSASPTNAPTAEAYIDYVVTGCWGISYWKDDSDGEVYGNYNYNQFQQYVSNGLVQDMLSICQYVQNNLDSLNVNPNWNAIEDCIYYQYLESYNNLPASSKSVNNALLQWAQSDYTAGSMLGIISNTSTSGALPVWVCSNFSLRSYIESVGGDPQFIIDMEGNWNDVFNTYSIYAKTLGVPIQVASSVFTYPVLSHRQQTPLYETISAVVVGFCALLLLFTLSDYGLTVFGSLSIFTIIIIVICIHLFIESAQLDLFDFIVVPALVLLIADFPVQLIVEYTHARALLDMQQMIRADKTLSPALAATNKYFRQTVLFPTILVIMFSIAPLYARFQILRRIASYIIIIAIVSLVFTVCIEPYMLAFGCRTKHFEAICFVELEDGDANPEDSPEGNNATGQEVSRGSHQNSPQQATEIEEDDRRSNPSRSTISRTMSQGSRARSRNGHHHHLRRLGSNASASSIGSRGHSVDSRLSAGVMSLPGSVSSGLQMQPLSNRSLQGSSMYRTPPSYYPVGVASEEDYGYPQGAMPMMTPPPPGPGSMYYPQHPLSVQRYTPPLNAPDPRLMMARPDLLAQYQRAMYNSQYEQAIRTQTRQTTPAQPYRPVSANPYYGSMYGGGPTGNGNLPTPPLYANHGGQYPLPTNRPYSSPVGAPRGFYSTNSAMFSANGSIDNTAHNTAMNTNISPEARSSTEPSMYISPVQPPSANNGVTTSNSVSINEDQNRAFEME